MTDPATSAAAPSLTHLRQDGSAHMVDVTDKPATDRTARAEGCIVMQPETLALIREGDAKKGDVIGTARLAGIMAAKRTHELIPLCHPLLLSKVRVAIELDDALPGLRIGGGTDEVLRTIVAQRVLDLPRPAR